jgi:hypothetical protein
VPHVPEPRAGVTLEVKGRRLPFSFFPVTRGTRRYGLYDAVFAVSSWAVMRGAINERVAEPQRAEATAFLEQAEDFYSAASTRLAANPLLLYYSFLNLGKAMLRALGFGHSLDRARHGLSEELVSPGSELRDARVIARDSGTGQVNIYPQIVEQLGFSRPADGTDYPVSELLSQCVVGHRLWREADRANKERFISIQEIEIVKDAQSKEVWLRLYVPRGDLERYGITRTRLLTEARLTGQFRK